jgi:flagellar biosynthesis/type III secretory pathway M-ring protein FliF/YscJ
MNGAYDVLATDGLKVLGTLGFFVPAAILVTIVIVAVVRDRRLAAREAEEEAAEQAGRHEALDDYEDVQGRRPSADRPTPPPAG